MNIREQMRELLQGGEEGQPREELGAGPPGHQCLEATAGVLAGPAVVHPAGPPADTTSTSFTLALENAYCIIEEHVVFC